VPMSRRQSAPAHLAKAEVGADLVGEFPELQWLMGNTTRERRRSEGSITAAKANDLVPTDPVERGGCRSRIISIRWSGGGEEKGSCDVRRW